MSTGSFFIYKRGPVYYIQFTDDKGRTKQLSTGRKKKSEAMKFALENSHHFENTSSKVSLSTFIASIKAHGVNVYAKSTLRSYVASLTSLKAILGDHDIRSFTNTTIEKFKITRLTQVSKSSVNVELRSLKAVFSLAQSWSLIDKNPVDGVKLISVQVNSPIFLKRDEYTSIVNAITEQWLRQVVIFATLSGLRISEIVNLRWDDIDSESGVLRIKNSIYHTTKNKRERIIPITGLISEVLKEISKSCVKSGFVFKNKGNKLCPIYTSKKFKQYIRKLGLNPALHFHHLRATFASWMLMEGVDVFIVSKLLGHSDVSVTTKHYANVRDEYLLKAMKSAEPESVKNLLKMPQYLN